MREPSKTWNYRVERRTSWFTGLECLPAGKCSTRKCEKEAECWVACNYRTGRAGRVTTRSRAYCPSCAARIIAKHAPTQPAA